MSEKEKFSALLDEILEEIIKADMPGKKYEIPVITRNVIDLIRNLQVQVDEQNTQLIKMEDKITKLEHLIRIRKK